MTYLNRTYSLMFQQEGGDQYIWKQTANELGLALNFKAVKTISKEPNVAEIGIYNLSVESQNALMGGGIVQLSAGYADTNDIVILGSITSTSFTIEPSGDRLTTISTLANLVSKTVGNTLIKLEMGSGSSTTQIVQKLTDHIKNNVKGVKVTKYQILTPKIYKSGISSIGDVFQLLDVYLSDIGYIYFIDNGSLNIVKNTGTTTIPIAEISEDSGMIGAPKPVLATDDDGKSRIGIDFETILNPNLNIGGRVRIMSKVNKQVNLLYRIESLEHQGNSHAGVWKTKVKAWKV